MSNFRKNKIFYVQRFVYKQHCAKIFCGGTSFLIFSSLHFVVFLNWWNIYKWRIHTVCSKCMWQVNDFMNNKHAVSEVHWRHAWLKSITNILIGTHIFYIILIMCDHCSSPLTIQEKDIIICIVVHHPWRLRVLQTTKVYKV